jgi:hypothetical protein
MDLRQAAVRGPGGQRVARLTRAPSQQVSVNLKRFDCS